MSEDLLGSAARRAGDGDRSLYELRVQGREPALSPGPTWGYCRVRGECEGRRRSRVEREAMGLAPR